MADHDPVIAITPGEPSGIGPEILLKLKQQHPQFKLLAVADPYSTWAQGYGLTGTAASATYV